MYPGNAIIDDTRIKYINSIKYMTRVYILHVNLARKNPPALVFFGSTERVGWGAIRVPD